MTVDGGGDRPWHVHHTEMRIDLAADEVRVATVLHVRDGAGVLRLDGRGLTTHSVAVDGEVLDPSRYDLDERVLGVPLAPGAHRVTTEVSARPGAPND